ncbi:MAG: anthranilate phosphoribosyltransferase [Myxococcota bacterium]
MIARALRRVAAGDRLDRREMREVVDAIIAGADRDLEIAALLAVLSTRGETPDEVIGAAEALRAAALPLPEAPPEAIDTCGTGGSGLGTFNISTLAALAVAAAGVPVAKHGNRAASGRCGSADLLESLGVPVESDPQWMARAVFEVGIGFLFARRCHPAMARVAPIRRALGIPTLFNQLGPLSNPMRVRRQLVGVARRERLEPTARALVALGSVSFWVFHSEDARDELSLSAPTRVLAWDGHSLEERRLEPGRFVPAAPLSALVCGDRGAPRRVAREVLAGTPGPRLDAVALCAGAGLCVAGKVA